MTELFESIHAAVDLRAPRRTKTEVDDQLVVHEVNCEIHRQFAAGGIQIPFQQRDLHIKRMPSG